MRIVNCKTNHLKNPIGFDLSHVVMTWAVEESISKKQKSARLLVSTDESFTKIFFDTGEKSELDNRGVELTYKLSPYTRYFWKVTVWGDLGDFAVSETQFFETGKMEEPWHASWITTSWEDQKKSPYFRKTFELEKGLVSARLYIIGLGLYECEINGKRVGEERLTPYCNAYDAWLQYQTYDVKDSLKLGTNALGVTLGNGWAKGPFGTFGEMNTPYINDFALLCELHLYYENERKEVILTDTSWSCHKTPILEDSIYDGEVYDANLEIPSWSSPDFDDSTWEKAKKYQIKGLGPVVDRLSPPVVVKEFLKPITLLRTPKGEDVLDLGQNMVGWLKFKINEPKGIEVKLTHGEIMQNECFYRDNLRGAKAEYTYISDGTEKTIEPHFTFYGFRYVKLEGFTKPIDKDDFLGCVVYSDLDTIGNIATSNLLVNKLFLNALWGQKGNFLDVPTDCPQRDERMGWTGDAQVFSGTASFNMDSYAFYVKFMKDLYEEQKFSGGMVASTVPTFIQNKLSESSFIAGGACAWADAATVIPWEVYLHSGDRTILKRQYQSMKDWVDWIIRQDKNSGNRRLWTVGFHFGDWLALDGPIEGGVMGGTDKGLLASAYYRLSSNILAKTAKVLGKADEADYYSKISEEVKKAIQDEFFSKSGRSTIGTQTAHVVALHFDLVEQNVKNRVLEDLKALLKKSQMHLKTGFIGTPYLCRVLSDFGASEEAYQIFLQKDYPSWLYEVIMGATTVWERWNSVLPNGEISGTGMNSLNHYAYGSIIEWVYRNVCGLKPLEDAPGFKKFVVKPEINGKLDFASASLNSSMGQICTGYKLLGETNVEVNVKVPFNSSAKIVLEDAILNSIKGIDDSMEVFEREKAVVIEVFSGEYCFSFQTSKSYKQAYSLSSPLWQIFNNEDTKSLLNKYASHLIQASKGGTGFELPYSIQDLLDSDDSFGKRRILGDMDVEAYSKELEKIQFKV